MSIIITGLEMPTERESFNLTIKYNGTVLDTETGIQVAEAYEITPHGGCIDADALEQEAQKRLLKCNKVVRGKWIAWYGAVRCVECGHDTIIKSNFCPNCGADMRPDLPKEET